MTAIDKYGIISAYQIDINIKNSKEELFMAITDCSKCGRKLRIVPETVGNDSQGLPVIHRMGYCDNCKIKYDLDYVQIQNTSTASQKEEKKHSNLSIWALLLSLFGCTSFVAFILALADLCQYDKTKKHTGSWAALCFIFLYIVVFFGMSSGNSNTNVTETPKTEQQTVISSENKTNKEKEEIVENITYIKCTVDEMTNLLDQNALKAEKTYCNQYLEVTGKLNTIDSDGEYIALYSVNNEWDFTGVQCSIETEEQLNHVMELSTGDIVTVRIKCDKVGEILGYMGDIIEFVE